MDGAALPRDGGGLTARAGGLEVLARGLSFPESPRWRDDRLLVSDFHTRRVIAFGADGAVESLHELAHQPSGLGFDPRGRLLVVSMEDRRVLREREGRLVLHADLAALAGGPLNDMLVDPLGRAYVGNFGSDLERGAPLAPACLALVDPSGEATAVADGLLFPNGMTLDPAGETLLVAETYGCRISAFDVRADGRLENRRTWARFGPPAVCGAAPPAAQLPLLSVCPDGMALDAEGAVWIGDVAGAGALRVREGGEVVERIETPGLTVYAVALGGPDRRDLYLCAGPHWPDHDPARRDSVVLRRRVDVPGAGLP
ncbi:SMP-30/gluconolactonase/LRE family protein [Conexibacter woesei]|uniref:SMP-30/Gluconolaconase/LRE domain protein n=1 Tax=Conexibacter woesei (strain DSM 14684 / CCUG 47730 / CIP 108061 / JCM 11494 / NBRC 100937 / ID131577) TaxID=469383 RepID=D3F4H2_CONWI|nr:SMP-30/gluconolactonase/LRE family protein [Conexibacter woesei]ADB50544.1 SMP-30/Gluconolaconase/LRE domain protein [Conexibacter woesei DSM 14684]